MAEQLVSSSSGKDGQMVTCEICQRSFKTEQALSGHRRFKHHDAEQGPQQSRDDTQMATRGDVKQWAADTQSLLERQLEVLRSIDDSVDQLLDRQDGNPFLHTEAEAFANELAEKLDRIMIARHPARMCNNNDCQTCLEQRQSLTLDVLARIEERVPGTREAIATWELRNTPITIVG